MLLMKLLIITDNFMEKSKNKKMIIGLIGGMGPYASAYFYDLLLRKCSRCYGAINNDEYPEFLIDSVPVPDFISDTRKAVIAYKILSSRIKKLEAFGCTRIAMICNTGHILYSGLKKQVRVEFVSLVSEVAKSVVNLGCKKVGVLASGTTVNLRLYEKALNNLGVKVVYPIDEMQQAIESIIREVVSGKIKKSHKLKLSKMTQEFIAKKHLDGVVLGCTELPLIFPKKRFPNVVDCLEVLSDSLLKSYYDDSKKACGYLKPKKRTYNFGEGFEFEI
jgi:aspartate racemase